MFDGDVRHNLVHRTENFIARLFWRRLLGLDPLTTDFLLQVLTRLPHVPEKGSGGRGCSVRVVCRHPIARIHRVGRIHLVMLGRPRIVQSGERIRRSGEHGVSRGRVVVERNVPPEEEVPGCVVVGQVWGLAGVGPGEVVPGRGRRGVNRGPDHGRRLLELQRRRREMRRVDEGVDSDAGSGRGHFGLLVVFLLPHQVDVPLVVVVDVVAAVIDVVAAVVDVLAKFFYRGPVA